ncbi:MAG: hypothetical protein ACJATR_002959 [Halopseudomonas sp.]|jgi:hypothetical protein
MEISLNNLRHCGLLSGYAKERQIHPAFRHGQGGLRVQVQHSVDGLKVIALRKLQVFHKHLDRELPA